MKSVFQKKPFQRGNIYLEKWQQESFSAWRKKVNKRIPEVAAKVFSFRKVCYTGCGFHWSLEKSLGNLIACINDYDSPLDMRQSYYHGKEAPFNQIILKVKVKMFFKDVAEIERKLKENEV